jgi:hypothetical protein
MKYDFRNMMLPFTLHLFPNPKIGLYLRRQSLLFMRTNTFRNLLAPLFAILFLANAVFAQNLNSGFGKNRVQYHRQQQEWQYYETDHLITYWYGDARNIAVTALQMAEYDYDDVQQLLEYQLNERVEMLVFSDLTDLKQSNIGIDELFQIKSGETKVSGNKVFIYYDGNHAHLRRSVREGLAGIIINSMLFGSNLQEIVQNSVLLNLPGWYTDGLKAYCGEAWSTGRDEELRTALESGRYKKFDQLAKYEPILAGHAFWHYIALHFETSSISNLLYLTRINRGLDAGFRYVVGEGYETTTNTIFEYYQKRYTEDRKNTEQPKNHLKIKNKRKLPLSQPKISPDGQRVAWVQNDIGQWRIYIKNLRTGKQERILKGGHRNALQATDYAYPLLAWSMDNKTLGILYEARDVPKLALIDTETNKKEIKPISTEFQRVHSMDFINPVDLVFSGTARGYTDLYIYHSVTRQTERLTQDLWDDHDAAYVRLGDVRYLLFASNRPTDSLSQQRIDTVLAVGKSDIFLFNLDTRDPELIRLTQTPDEDERMPMAIDSAHFAWTNDQSGIHNRTVAYLEDFTAYNLVTFYLKNGAEAKGINTQRPGEWPLEKSLRIYPAADTVAKNIKPEELDSMTIMPIMKKRAVYWTNTNFEHNIQEMDAVAGLTPKILYTFKEGYDTRFYVQRLDSTLLQKPFTPYTIYRKQQLKAAGVALPNPIAPNIDKVVAPKTKMRDSIPPEWFFQVPEHLRQNSPAVAVAPPDDAEEEEKRSRPQKDSDLLWNTKALGQKSKYIQSQKRGVHRFNPSQIVPYRLKFRTDFFNTDVDNSLLFDGLDSYAGTPAQFRTPPPGLLMKANFKELLENYVIEAGVRLPTTFNGAEYYMWLDDKKRRIDRRIALYRRTQVRTINDDIPGLPDRPYQVRNNTVLGQYELRYPFSPFFSVRGMGTLRQDKLLTLSSDAATLETPDYNEQRASLRFTAVYDNSVDVDINLKTGSRAKFYVEVVKRFAFNTQPNWSLNFNQGIMTVLNLDARHYQRLDRHSILALRLAGATTFGSERILYYLGGVDNWLLPRFNQTIPVPQDENFAYETVAAHLRGFKQNIRNGGSFALVNTELRVPLFKYLLNRPVLGPFWRNFQLTGFFDAGTAWSGRNPYSGNNPINTISLQNPPTVYAQVKYFRDPVVAGYGLGMRMQVLGMFLRADYAWGIETRVVQKPIFHLALGADF